MVGRPGGRSRGGGVLLAGILLLTACSNDGEPASQASSSPDEVVETPAPSDREASMEPAPEGDAAVLGESRPASGDPIRVGVVYPDAALASLPEVGRGAQAAAAYANEYLGGLGGRPIEIVECGTDESDPASGRACANTLVDADVVAVLVGATSLGEEMVPVITGAGIPYVTASGVSFAELGTPGAFSLTAGFPASMAALALDAQQSGHEHVTLFVANVPAATQGAEGLARPIFDGLGIGLEIVPVDLGTPDMGPEVSAALTVGTDAMAIAGDVTLCAAFFNAYETAAAEVPVHAVSTCFGPGIETLVPDGALDGTIVYSGIDTVGDDEEAVLFRTVLEAFQPDTSPNGFSASAYQGLLTLVRVTADTEDDVTPESLGSALASSEIAAPVGGGLTLRCDGSAIPMLPAVCAGDYLRSVIDGTVPDGHAVVPTSQLFQAAGG